MIVSEKKSVPKYSFGTGTRKQHNKVYQNKHLSKIQFIGKEELYSLINDVR